MNSSLVCSQAHQSPERVDLAHQMALSHTPNRRIAGHHTDCVEPLRDQAGHRTHARSRSRGLGTRVATANHYYIKNNVMHVHRPKLAIDRRLA
jgi:hypothetical protein